MIVLAVSILICVMTVASWYELKNNQQTYRQLKSELSQIMIPYILTLALAIFYFCVSVALIYVMVYKAPPKEDGQFTIGNIMTFLALATSVVLFMNLK